MSENPYENKLAYTVLELAEHLGLHPTFVRKEIKSGKLRAILKARAWRIRKEWVIAWLEDGAEGGPEVDPVIVQAEVKL